MRWFLAALLLLAVAVTYIRLAPSDPDDWHTDIAAAEFVPEPGWATFCPGFDTRYSILGPPDLKLFADVADGWPRTTRLAGSVDEGRITWVTRSALFGFPDYTTAALVTSDPGTQICMVARQRFGLADFGVNARRLSAMLMDAYGYLEPPPLAWRNGAAGGTGP